MTTRPGHMSAATLLTLLAAARRAGLVITRADDELAITAPSGSGQLVKALRARTRDVLPLADLYAGRVDHLDWRAARVLDDPRPCVICRRPARLVDPYDGQPAHKACAEHLVRHGATLAAARSRRRMTRHARRSTPRPPGLRQRRPDRATEVDGDRVTATCRGDHGVTNSATTPARYRRGGADAPPGRTART